MLVSFSSIKGNQEVVESAHSKVANLLVSASYGIYPLMSSIGRLSQLLLYFFFDLL